MSYRGSIYGLLSPLLECITGYHVHSEDTPHIVIVTKIIIFGIINVVAYTVLHVKNAM